MGTRNLTIVFYQGEYRLMQYGQWDGYPEGQGWTVLKFVRDRMDRDKFLSNLMQCQELTDEKRDEINALGPDKWQRQYPQLSRDMGGEILAYIQDQPPGLIIHRDMKFVGNSLMCEWAYVIDFDAGTLEAFKGFNTEPLDPSERFASVPVDNDHEYQDDKRGKYKYYQIKLASSWRLDTLPTDEKFVAELTPPDEDEEAA